MLSKTKQHPSAESANSDIHLYAAHDPIPVPEATVSDSDASWALWELSLLAQCGGSEADFRSTVPAELPAFLFNQPLNHPL